MCAMKGLNRRQFITSSTALTGAAMLPWSFSAHAAAVASATPVAARLVVLVLICAPCGSMVVQRFRCPLHLSPRTRATPGWVGAAGG